MASIKPIEGRSVHQIQSGQVIVDLQSVCKELVENSIDAGATSVEVRFRNSGLDAIEVQDNGAGIAPVDYETIALKHYTSKLSSYDDLSSLQTFGFRGEALSSLCALSNFYIVTARPVDGPKGTKLEFEQSGKLKETSVVAAKQGTMVVVETLFHNLPVRRKELEKNIKREYNKVLHLLNAYACISVGVKFAVSNLLSKGKKMIAFSTNSNLSTKDNISNVYGTKTTAALIPLSLEFEMDASSRLVAIHNARNGNTQDSPEFRTVKIVGHISRPVVGEGRQTPDRQMFFVNSRPCNLPQVAKAFNEVYKSYNITQSAFIFADIQLNTNAYDVNVSPDKRTIMLHDQTVLLESLKEALVKLFEEHDQSVPQAQLLGENTVAAALRISARVPRVSTDLTMMDDPSESASTSKLCQKPPEGTDVPSRPQTFNAAPGPGFVKASLIETFAGRDAQERAFCPPARQKRDSSSENGKSAEERVIHSQARQQSTSSGRELQHAYASPSPRSRSQSPLFESALVRPSLSIRSEQPPKAVQDFNARMASQTVRQQKRGRGQSPTLSDVTVIDDPREKEFVPALMQTPLRSLSQSTIQSAFDRMRPTKTPAHHATITTGDTTTVATIGTASQPRSSKRIRVHTPKSSLMGTPLDQTFKGSLFMESLRGFAAPGTQSGSSDDEEDDQDSGMSDAPVRLPISHRRTLPRAFEEPCTDDLIGTSSAPPLPRPSAEQDPSGSEILADAGLDIVLDAQGADDECMDEDKRKATEEAKIVRLIADAEEAVARPTEANIKRANRLFKVSQNKYQTTNLERVIATNWDSIAHHLRNSQLKLRSMTEVGNSAFPISTQLNKEDPEERLSLTVAKQDFNEMLIIGQFNLGFIIAVRPPTLTSRTSDLFIIDQHASDEKYNFERLSATTTLVSQRLVHPHPLELTAVEEELILTNERSLTANGFIIQMDTTSNLDSGRRAKLTSLPMSEGVTFTPTDLEELLALILDNPISSSTSSSPHIPRPTKVRRLLASRACRSSVMIGKTLPNTRMREIVKHMGSMDKPWSCPHGRPTMRHLYGFERWEGWEEGDGVVGVDKTGEPTNWASFLRERRL